MTLIIALSCKNIHTGDPMLLVASDKQASNQYIKTVVTKLRPLPSKYSKNKPKIIFAASGDAYIADEICDVYDAFISEHYDEIKDVNIFINNNRNFLSNVVAKIFTKYGKRGCSSNIDLFLCGCNNEYGPIILNIINDGRNIIYYDHCIIGMGSLTGGELLLNELFNAKLDDTDATKLALLIIKLVSEIDISVGKGIDIFSCMNNKVLELEPDDFTSILKISDNNWNIIKKIWWNMNNDYVILKVKELIKEIEKNENGINKA